MSSTFRLEYLLNPTPLDRNLEYNGENIGEDEHARTRLNADYLNRFPEVLLRQDERIRALPELTIEEGDKNDKWNQ